MTDDQDSQQSRSRLIDHFKRVYTIVVGLAITEAVRRQFPMSFSALPNPSFWMVCTFFITVVPIFHGGDRSLDVKYLGAPCVTMWQRICYLWDVYMLLITAILFVSIAEVIPKPAEPPTADGVASFIAGATQFYRLMAVTLAFDAVILAVDYVKSESSVRARLRSYFFWIFANLALAAICYHAAALTAAARDTSSILQVFGCLSLDLPTVALAVAVLALFRTLLDYWAGREFLFP